MPQLHGQYEGDRSRKETLIEHGFRLPSAADNRPLRFEEFMSGSARSCSCRPRRARSSWSTPPRSSSRSCGPTGLVDPEVIVKPTKGQIDDLIEQINAHGSTAGARVLVTTLTKKMAEDLSDYLLELGVQVRYLHSEVDTIERIEILRDLRLGEFDVLVGINLLREGLDLPEVSLVAILDADKEGFLRSETSLIQTIGRAAPQRRRPGDHVRRQGHRLDAAGHLRDQPPARPAAGLQRRARHRSRRPSARRSPTSWPTCGRRRRRPCPAPTSARAGATSRAPSWPSCPTTSWPASSRRSRRRCMTPRDLRFEYAARLRDEIKDLKRELREVG